MAEDGAVTPYAPIETDEPKTITLGGSATGTLYFNVFNDGNGNPMATEATIVWSSDTTRTQKVTRDSTTTEQGYISATTGEKANDAHGHYTIEHAEEVRAITICPTMTGHSSSIYYIIFVGTDGTVTPYVNVMNNPTGSITVFFDGAPGTIYINWFYDEVHEGTSYTYVKDVTIVWGNNN